MERISSRIILLRGIPLWALAFYVLTIPALKGELVWEKRTVEVTSDARTPVLEAHFRFKNSGSKQVEIRNVESSCGCTTTALAKQNYAPKESGEIVAKYTIGAHTGLQKKTILVTANDGKEPTTLTLVAHIPEILRVEPLAASWPHNASPEPKHIALEVVDKAPLDEISVESSSPSVTTELTTVTKGHKYDLLVTPKQTDRFLYSKLTIHCRFGDEQKTFVAYATVQPSTDPQ